MPAPLRVDLSQLEKETLSKLQKADSVPYRTRNRAHMLMLNAQGINVPEIARIFDCHQHTVRAAIERWKSRGLVGLWSAPGRGAKPKWKTEDLEYIEACLKEEERTYNSVQLAWKLRKERGVNLSSDRLRRILKKKYRWKRTKQSNRKKQNKQLKAIKKTDLMMLEMAAKEGIIDLKYLDEAGFCLWSPVSYSYSQIGTQKVMQQSRKKYGSRISILGLWQAGKSFEYGLAQGGFNGKSYIKFMNWIAKKAVSVFRNTGKLTVVVQDNSPIHRSHEVRACWKNWSEKGLLLFFLPAYCPDLNPIETQWHQLKAHEIAGQIFDNEYDLAMAVIQGMKHRSELADYYLERFIFNSA